MVREESKELVRWAMLLEQSHEKVFHFRIDRNNTLRERIHLLGLTRRNGVVEPLLQVFEHLLLESFAWEPRSVEALKERLENQPQELRDQVHVA
jgi:hypothetical protein